MFNYFPYLTPIPLCSFIITFCYFFFCLCFLGYGEMVYINGVSDQPTVINKSERVGVSLLSSSHAAAVHGQQLVILLPKVLSSLLKILLFWKFSDEHLKLW